MNKDTVIEVEGLSKKFARSVKASMLYGIKDISKNLLGISSGSEKLRKGEFWALDDISFSVKKGETLGIIGLNGSGKSTMLKLLNGIFMPDKGKISIRGKVSALIEVGAGFHPLLTGRENIYVNAAILGMTKKATDEKINDIIEFADIGDFIDSPVKHYSSGMFVRLGFAAAIHCDPDILLVDEILSVGDISFRNKSLRFMDAFRKKANAVIFVSHNMEQIRVLCDRVIILNKGKLVFNGPTPEGCVKYNEISHELRKTAMGKEFAASGARFRESSGEDVLFDDIGFINHMGEKTNEVGMNEPLVIRCCFSVKENIAGLYFSVGIVNEENKNCIWVMSNDNNKAAFTNLNAGKYMLEVSIPEHHLMPNVYYLNIGIRNSGSGETYEKVFSDSVLRITSDGLTMPRGIINVNERWELKALN